MKTNSIYPLHCNNIFSASHYQRVFYIHVLIITFVLLSRSSLESPIADCVPGRITTTQKCHNIKTQELTLCGWLFHCPLLIWLYHRLVTNKIMYLIIAAIYICMIGTEITSMYILCIVQFLLNCFMTAVWKSNTSINMYPTTPVYQKLSY